MGLDIRVPLGLIFLIIGTIMTIYGFFTRGSIIYASSMGVNLNLLWDSAMIVCGTLAFIAGRRGRRMGP